MFIKSEKFSASELSRFKELQQLSFSILRETASNLYGGETEKEVARLLVKKYKAAGVGSFFHLPVVLFGERTALPGDWTIGHFFPKRKTLEPGDSVILDAAPLFDGFLVDTSYSFCFGKNETHRSMMQHLSQYRELVVNSVNKGMPFNEISENVKDKIQAAGYNAVHAKHPGEVLGHRAIKTSNLPFQIRIQGFDAVSIIWFKFKEKWARTGLGRRSPLWNASETSKHLPHDGLWLVEPHAGLDSVGAKWEEILLIENGKARWLEDTPPHVIQWENIEAGVGY